MSDNGLNKDLKVVGGWRQAGDGESQLSTGTTESLEDFGPGGNQGVRATTANEVDSTILESAPGGMRGVIRAAVQDGGIGDSGNN
jgi:hypothetical protein